ncbi:MAG TPA: DUF707 domain-containing protein [Paenibacillus sp.]|uniref:DUF707 domain-containing protein n=1 Tax=Paenibacillus sp. TaxID=58172 RepID=UPI002CF91893|nr:DUF707 domain-containing protein [Paenibacillus sp.]HUC90529.1 DUF707 domain-containing protein [Paenibacillus sp.]
MTDDGLSNRYLVVARVGDRSLHHQWIHPAEDRNFDLFLSYYGNSPGRYAEECEFYTACKGTKWQKIHELIANIEERVFRYDAVWFPDDDISTTPGNISGMFRLFQEHGLLLAQPALTANSYFKVTAQHIDYRLRYTHFVEIMVPIFSRDALKACWRTFDKSVTGWGMEHVWAKLLSYPFKKMAILDETPVKHTRLPGQGELYENIKNELKIDIWDERNKDVWKEYGIAAPEPSDIGYYDGIKLWDPYAPSDDVQDHDVQPNQAVSRENHPLAAGRTKHVKRKPPAPRRNRRGNGLRLNRTVAKREKRRG